MPSLGELLTRAADELEGKVVLVDAADDDDPSRQVACRIESYADGIYIKPEGYGDYCAAPGKGCPVMVEFFNGELRVVAWPDINDEESVHIIDLEGAREDVREDDEDNDIPENKGDDNG